METVFKPLVKEEEKKNKKKLYVLHFQVLLCLNE